MLDGYRLLVIESAPLMAEVTAYRLQLLGYPVSVTAVSRDAWSVIEDSRPDAILLSLDADAHTAYDLMERLTSDTTTAGVPILVMSETADLDRVERAWKQGAADYLVTPYDPLVLEQKVSRLLRDRVPREQQQTEAGQPVLAAAGTA